MAMKAAFLLGGAIPGYSLSLPVLSSAQRIPLYEENLSLSPISHEKARDRLERPKAKREETTGEYLPNGASQKAGLNNRIADAAWSAFFDALMAKAEEAERTVIKVPPAYSTQTWHDCGQKQSISLSVRVYSCEQCGVVRDRNHNASRNILQAALARQSQGARPQEAPGF